MEYDRDGEDRCVNECGCGAVDVRVLRDSCSLERLFSTEGLSLSTTLLLCQENVNAENCLKILNVLDTNRLQQIEDALNLKVEDIRTILTGQNEKQRGEIVEKLNSKFSSLWPDIITSDYANVKNEIKNIKEFVNVVFVPNQIPNSFLCAWNLKVETLEDVYKKEGLQSFGETMNGIFKMADDAAKLKGGPQIITKMQGKRTLSEDEFIDVFKSYAPDLDENLIQDVAHHSAPSYEYRGKRHYYLDNVLKRYTEWLEYLKEKKGTLLQQEIVSKLKLHYKDNWLLGAQKFALTMSRDHFVGNCVKHYFWEEYQRYVYLKPHMDFDEILDSVFPEGWYYTKQSLDHFHLLVQALKTTGRRDTELVLQYEPFFNNPSVGMPQSLACRFSKREFDYFYARWSTTTSTTTTKKVA